MTHSTGNFENRARGFVEKAGTKAGELIGRYLPEPTEKNGSYALQGAVVFVILIAVVLLIGGGLLAGIIQLAIMIAIMLLGMYAGIPVFGQIRARKDAEAKARGDVPPSI